MFSLSIIFFKIFLFFNLLIRVKHIHLSFFNFFFLDNLFVLLISLLFIICILISVAFFTLLERKKLASFQRRKGPNVEGGISGILQPIADGVKLVFKEVVLPNNSFGLVFVLSPLIAFCLGFAS